LPGSWDTLLDLRKPQNKWFDFEHGKCQEKIYKRPGQLTMIKPASFETCPAKIDVNE